MIWLPPLILSWSTIASPSMVAPPSIFRVRGTNREMVNVTRHQTATILDPGAIGSAIEVAVNPGVTGHPDLAVTGPPTTSINIGRPDAAIGIIGSDAAAERTRSPAQQV